MFASHLAGAPEVPRGWCLAAGAQRRAAGRKICSLAVEALVLTFDGGAVGSDLLVERLEAIDGSVPWYHLAVEPLERGGPGLEPSAAVLGLDSKCGRARPLLGCLRLDRA